MTEHATVAEPGTRRRRRLRGRRNLYEPVGWSLVRMPVLPVEAFLALAPDEELAPRDPLVRTALAVGSRELLSELDRAGSHPGKETQRLRAKLLRYLIRMSTRPTPYGLFAGVNLARFGEVTDLRIAASPPRTRTRPDMDWLLELVARLEARPEVRRELRVFANPAVLQHGERAFLAERAVLRTGDAAPVGIRATGAVRRALTLARAPVAWKVLAEELLATPGATAEKVERLLDELWEQTFLLAELRPPLTAPSPARHVAGCLAAVAPAVQERDALETLLAEMEAWDRLAMDERPAAYEALGERAAAALPDFQGTHAQVDTQLALDGGLLHEAVAREAAKAAELLLRLTPAGGGVGQLDGFRNAFVGRYGTEREVPLVELLDPDHGLGPPMGHGWSNARADQAKLAVRNQTLRGLALDALRDRRLSVELDDATLSRLALTEPNAETAPLSVDLAVFVLAESVGAIDDGAFELLIGPNLGAQAAGRNLGRFGDLLGEPGRAALEEVAAAGARHHPGDAAAELVYLPRRGRSANVVIRPAIHRHEIALGVLPGVSAGDAIPLSEVLIGLREGRFYARWPAVDGDLRVHAGHMLNSHQAPTAIRFLEDLSRDGRMQLNSFGWGPAAELPFTPRIGSGRIILAAAQWQLDHVTRDASLAPSDPDFACALARWREAWMVPRRVYLTVADNRLLLDLEVPEQIEGLREELRGLREGAVLLLQEPLPGPEHAWLEGPDGRHLTELVVPLALRAPAAVSGQNGERPATLATSPQRAVLGPRERLRPPGSDWLFVKLYCPRNVEEDLLTGPIRSFCQFAVGSGLAERWFFLRYSDPDPHVRLRFGGSPDRLVEELFPKICAWTAELIAEGACQRIGIDTYEREVERYGGLAGIELAEALFSVDSPAVVELLRLAQGELPTIDRTTLGVLSVDALLEGLRLSATERLDWYRAEVSAKHHSGDAYRARQGDLRRLLGDSAACASVPGGVALKRVLAARSAALAPIAARLDELGRQRQLECSRERLCQSYVHLHCNRLLGSGPPTEQQVLGLLLRTRESLDRAPAITPAERIDHPEGGNDVR